MTEPKRKVGRPPKPKGAPSGPRYMTADEVTAFLKAARRAGPKWGAMWELVFFYALRLGEVTALRLEDLDLAAHRITIRAEKSGTTRTYLLPEKLERQVRAWLKRREAKPGAAENPYLFPGRWEPRTGHITNIGAWKQFKVIAVQARLATAHSPHDLRHTAASFMLAEGDTVVTAKEWLRHKWLSSTDRYLHDVTRAKHEREMAERAGRFL